MKKKLFNVKRCPGAPPYRFRQFWAKSGTVWQFFGLKKIKKNLSDFKIMVEQKEKLFWKALYPNKLIGY